MLHEHHFRAMNTDVGVWLWSTARERDDAVRRELLGAEAFFATVEDALSRFRPESSLSRLNDAAGAGWQAVSPLLWTVLRTALHAAEDSGGIYDPTLLHALERTGYDRTFEAVATGAPEITTAVTVASAFGSWMRVRMDSATRSVSLPAGLGIDLGGIAKGWTGDRVARALAGLGPVLVDAGGDVRVIGTVGDEAWPIAVQDPFEAARDRGVVRLRHGALATSSIGGRCWVRRGRACHHVLDARTGMPAQSDLHTVTVRAPCATTGGVASKVALVLESGPGASYLADRGLSGWLTTIEGCDIAVGGFELEDYLSRASGFVAYVLLWGSVVWGLLLSSGMGRRWRRPPQLLQAHQFFSTAAIGFASFHGLVLMGDRYMSFAFTAIVIPFASSYEPLLLACGQVGFWLSVLLIVSFHVRRRIGGRAWRRLHYASFAAFWMAFVHGLLLGSDTAAPWASVLYLATGTPSSSSRSLVFWPQKAYRACFSKTARNPGAQNSGITAEFSAAGKVRFRQVLVKHAVRSSSYTGDRG